MNLDSLLLYFDTVNYSLYKSSIEKDVDTYKVRVRTYSNNKNYFKEVKKNMSSGKYKLIEPLDIKSFSEISDLFINEINFTQLYSQNIKDVILIG